MEVTAGLYARISLDRAGAGLGVERQLEDCRALARTRGWEIAGQYADNDLSAYSGKRRPEFERLLADVEAGTVTGIVCWHVDRLTRQPRELEDLILQADRLGLALATVTGDIDLATPTGRMMARILGATARYESEQKSARHRRQIAQAAQGGRPHGGHRPFGYLPDRVTPDPAEAPVVTELAARVLAGERMLALCRELHARGIPTSAGKPWSVVAMKRMLTSPRIAGLRTHGARTYPATWPGLITPETSEALRARLARPAPGPPHRYLLTGGLAVCGSCGHPLFAHRSHGLRVYLCGAKYRYGRSDYAASCGRVSIDADWLEEHVANLALARLSTRSAREKLAGRLGNPDSAPALDELRAAQARLAELAAVYGSGSLSLAEYQAAREPATRRVEAAQRRLAEVTGISPLLGVDLDDLLGWWEAAPPASRRALVRVVFQQVIVGPSPGSGPRVDEVRVQIVWSQ
jgi:site-specific DNA recombinase